MKPIESYFSLKLVVGVVVALLALFYVFYFLTKFEKVITVKSKNNIGVGGGKRSSTKNIFMDDEGNVYNSINQPLIMFFGSYEVYSGLEVGKTYKIRGYGKRFLWFVPNVTDFNNETSIMVVDSQGKGQYRYRNDVA